jgi:hypothetical protein
MVCFRRELQPHPSMGSVTATNDQARPMHRRRCDLVAFVLTFRDWPDIRPYAIVAVAAVSHQRLKDTLQTRGRMQADA